MLQAHDHGTELPQRRSLLPQKSNTKQIPTCKTSVPKQPAMNDEVKESRVKTGDTDTGQRPRNNTTSMLPPASLGASRSIREPRTTATLRRPSTAKPPAPNPHSVSTRKRTSSAEQDSQINMRASNHSRAVSRQAEQSGVPRPSLSRATLSQPLSTKSQRPAFTAMQQSFTPKKKLESRPTSPSGQPASKEKVLSSDRFHLQMELAQLHLLHRSAQSIQRQWEQSAEERFLNRFNALSGRHAELREIADQQHALINQLTLVQWSKAISVPQIAEKVALLSQNIADVCSLIDAEGKYTRILEVFESWFAQALQTREQRDLPSTAGETALDLIEGIGDGWKAETMVLERELTYCLREFKAFGSVRPNSSLGRIRSLYMKLTLDLVQELDTIQWIENEITIEDTIWVENTIQRLTSNVNRNIGSLA